MGMTKIRLFLSALAAGLMMTGAAAPTSAGEAVTVVELFTSQGCNVCPPADAFLVDLAAMEDEEGLIVLGFHVNYWDYLGWADTFAEDITTSRQRGYMDAFSLRSVYTPQIVVDGTVHMAGSDRKAVMSAIMAAQDGRMAAIADPMVVLQEDGLYLSFERARTDLRGKADVWVMLYDRRHDVEVLRGENAGETITYVNVVRRIDLLGIWNGKKVDFALDMEVLGSGYDGCVVIVQMPGNGPILAATRIHLGDNAL
jgi:hypothetical protein